MRKMILLLGFTMCTSIVFAQLKVTSDGKVGIGLSSTQTPISKFTVGTIGEDYCNHVFQGDMLNVRIIGLGNSPYSYGEFGAALLVSEEVTSIRGDYGIRVSAKKSSPTSSGRAIGISSSAGNATNGYNWGVIGSLDGDNNGAAILGGLGIHQGFVINDGKYAGYFVGNVKVTGTINGVVVGNSDIRYKDNVEEFDNSGKSNVLSSILRLTPVSYNYKQIYVDEVSSKDSIDSNSTTTKTGLYDETSEMFRKKHFGLVAQDLQQIYPDLVYENDNGYLSVNYIELVPLLIQSVKELKAEIDALSSASIAPRAATASDVIPDISRAVLYQNAPNPFSERTEIKFELPDNAVNASIFIFNMQGTLLKQLPVGRRQQSMIINGSELTAGMYLYSLIVDGKEVDTKRMILTK